ncbi:Kinesin-like protein [Trichinella spiralis]|uniref:Kinesin-like protein n=1 Tax=Trichinella spiralis TaxID=6334 RepID=A0ABR3L367_TRISP
MPFPDVFSIPKQVELKHMKDLKEFKDFLFLPKTTTGKNANQEKQNYALNNLVDLKSIRKAIDVPKLTAICKTVTKIGKFKRMAEAAANLTDDPEDSQSASDLISRQKWMEMIYAFIPDAKNTLQQSDLLGNLMDHLVSPEFVGYLMEGFGKSRNRTVS